MPFNRCAEPSANVLSELGFEIPIGNNQQCDGDQVLSWADYSQEDSPDRKINNARPHQNLA